MTGATQSLVPLLWKLLLSFFWCPIFQESSWYDHITTQHTHHQELTRVML